MKTGPACRRGPSFPSCDRWSYLLVEPEVLPLPIEPLLGDLVVAPVEPPVEPDVLPLPIEPVELLPLEPDVPEELVPPLLELEPDLLKCASHSEREIWPSLFVSTDEKLGCEALLLLEPELGEVLLDEPPAAPVDDLPLDELPLADGEDDELPLADGEAELPDDDLSSAATASVERAKSAAAVVTVTVLSILELL